MTTYHPQSERTHYLTLQEAVAEGFGAYSTLRLWIAQGKLPAYKTGKRVKVLREDLEALAVPVRANPVDHAIDKLVAAAPFFGWAWASVTWGSLWWQKIMIPLGTIGAAVAFVLFVLRVAQWVHDELG